MRERPDRKQVALIADDHGLYRAGLGLLLRDRLSFDVVLEAESFDAAVDKLAVNRNVALALFDLGMPGMGGPEGLAQVRETYPMTRLAIISGLEDKDHVMSAISAGLSGYIPKTLSEDEIVEAIEGVLEDKIFVPRLVMQSSRGIPAAHARRAIEDAAPAIQGLATDRSLDDLTPRQRHVLDCISRGLSNKEVARELGIAEGTVKIHLAALFAHFKVRNRTELAILVNKPPG